MRYSEESFYLSNLPNSLLQLSDFFIASFGLIVSKLRFDSAVSPQLIIKHCNATVLNK